MSIGFSIIFYNVTVRELGRRPRDISLNHITSDPDTQVSFQDYLTNREQESRIALLADLVIVNVVVLIAGGLLSYLLAQYTLRPIEENMESQSLFVSDASHELRTPLTALRTANEVALRNKKLHIAEARLVIAENIDDIARLQDLTDSMLGLLRDDTIGFQPDVPLAAVVGDAMGMVVNQAQAKDISVEDETRDATLRGNARSLTQLLTILLDNAIKYSAEKTTIHIGSQAAPRLLTLTVRDEGVGMSQKTLEHIFTRFYRAEESRSASGYGLGLPIAKKIAEAHGGKIVVTSTLDVGTTVTVTLPIVNV